MKKYNNLKHITLKQTAIAEWKKYGLKPLYWYKNRTFSVIRRMETIAGDKTHGYTLILKIVVWIDEMDRK